MMRLWIPLWICLLWIVNHFVDILVCGYLKKHWYGIQYYGYPGVVIYVWIPRYEYPGVGTSNWVGWCRIHTVDILV